VAYRLSDVAQFRQPTVVVRECMRWTCTTSVSGKAHQKGDNGGGTSTVNRVSDGRMTVPGGASFLGGGAAYGERGALELAINDKADGERKGVVLLAYWLWTSNR
jgi:hypothetical protein